MDIEQTVSNIQQIQIQNTFLRKIQTQMNGEIKRFRKKIVQDLRELGFNNRKKIAYTYPVFSPQESLEQAILLGVFLYKKKEKREGLQTILNHGSNQDRSSLQKVITTLQEQKKEPQYNYEKQIKHALYRAQTDIILAHMTKEFCATACPTKPVGCCAYYQPERFSLEIEEGMGKSNTKNKCVVHTEKGCSARYFKPDICYEFLCNESICLIGEVMIYIVYFPLLDFLNQISSRVKLF